MQDMFGRKAANDVAAGAGAVTSRRERSVEEQE
jgi:hypothetical protein